MRQLNKIYREQIVVSNIETVWKFFSDPRNLSKITPEYLNFRILTKDLPSEIFHGLIIEYKVSPFLNIDFHWITEITALKKNEYFIDEQRFGPYKFWHHLHTFEVVDENRVKIVDLVHYLLPLGIAGRLMNSVMIRRRLNHIFDYRAKVIANLFNQF
ncbi:hypothetical protein D9V87_07015 [Bacteroidetes/Chlorobi group bacterium MS-B_bin-24]|jgi:ligand-binding SRPBCC domain-containing protein|nr:MAG: hypothetical protein D9V87_07015 [Bacteroidetes/Chlorobi group bacterium MS-B_bin-24]